MAVREAVGDDLLDALRVLDGANLSFSHETLERRIDAGTVLVAAEEGRVLGVCVCVHRDRGAHVEAVAVQRRRRDRGIGTALVEAAMERWGMLTADFDPHLRPFYEQLGFDVEEQRGGRFRGVLE